MAGEVPDAIAQQHENPFEAIFSVIPVPVWVYDRATLRFLEVNAAAVHLYGYSRDQMLAMRLPEIEPTTVRTPRPGRRESDHLTRNGRLIEVEIHTERTTWQGRPAHVATITDLTAQRESERRLRSAESLISSVVATAHEAILTIDEDLRITSMNPAACAMFRTGERGAPGSSLERFIPAPFREEYGARLIACGISGSLASPVNMEMLLLRADGSAFVGDAGIAHGENDGRRYIAIVLRDTTQQREADAALRDSERRYHLLASVAPVGIFRLDDEGRCLYVNERLCTLAGRSSEEMLGLGWSSVVHPDDQPVVVEEWSRALRHRQPFQAEVRLLGPHDRTTWVLAMAHSEQDEDGAIRSYIGTVTNISRRRAAEDALRESEALYHTLAAVAPVGIFRTDAAGDCIFINERACTITGRSVHELLGTRWEACVHPDDRDRVVRAWRDTVEKDLPYQEEMRFEQPDGTPVRVLCAAVPERGENGAVRGYLGTMTDLPMHSCGLGEE